MPRTTEWSFFLQHFAGTYPSTKLVPPYGSFIINTYVYKSTVDTDVSKTNEKLPAILLQKLLHCPYGNIFPAVTTLPHKPIHRSSQQFQIHIMCAHIHFASGNNAILLQKIKNSTRRYLLQNFFQ